MMRLRSLMRERGVVGLMVFSEGCVFEKGPFLGFWQSPGGNTEKAEV